MKALGYFGLAVICLALNTWLTVASLHVNSYGLTVMLNRQAEIGLLRSCLNAGAIGFTLAAVCVILKPKAPAFFGSMRQRVRRHRRAILWCGGVAGAALLLTVGIVVLPSLTRSRPKAPDTAILGEEFGFEPDAAPVSGNPSQSPPFDPDAFLAQPKSAQNWGEWDEIVLPAPSRRKMPANGAAPPRRALPVRSTPTPQGAR